MKAFLTAIILLLSFACKANRAMRTTAPRRAPLQGKVKTVRYGVYRNKSYRDTIKLSAADALKLSFNDLNYYSVDSFSEQGLKLYTKDIHEGATIDSIAYIYDTNGNKIEERAYDKDNMETVLMRSKYDAAGDLTEENFTPHGRPPSYTTYTYNGHRLAAKHKEPAETTNYSYNDKGQIVKEVSSYTNGRGQSIYYTYDKQGRIASEAESHGQDTLLTTFTYDEHNNEILAEEYRGGRLGMHFTSEYVYDSHGNWIRCMEEGPHDSYNSPQMITVREIEYY